MAYLFPFVISFKMPQKHRLQYSFDFLPACVKKVKKKKTSILPTTTRRSRFTLPLLNSLSNHSNHNNHSINPSNNTHPSSNHHNNNHNKPPRSDSLITQSSRSQDCICPTMAPSSASLSSSSFGALFLLWTACLHLQSRFIRYCTYL